MKYFIILIFLNQIFRFSSTINQINEVEEIKYLYPYSSKKFLYTTIFYFKEIDENNEFTYEYNFTDKSYVTK